MACHRAHAPSPAVYDVERLPRTATGSMGRMSIWTLCLFGVAIALVAGGALARLRAYRSLLWGSAVLVTITALFPRPGNPVGQYLFAAAPVGLHLPIQLIGLAWWILGAWLVKSGLALVLSRTIFPHDNQPHARRLFADLASVLVYVIAFVGIIETVVKQPISAVLATSGVLAIVFGLALQNTLADVFSGLAINIEHPFRTGDWITFNGDVEGEVMEINWRATRMRSAVNDLIHCIEGARVLEVLRLAAAGCPGVSKRMPPAAYACGFADSLVAYQLCFGIDNFVSLPEVQSDVVRQTLEACRGAGIPIGRAPLQIRVVPQSKSPGLEDGPVRVPAAVMPPPVVAASRA